MIKTVVDEAKAHVEAVIKDMPAQYRSSGFGLASINGTLTGDGIQVGMGVAVVKPEGGAVIDGVTFYPITEEQFLSAVVDRPGVKIERFAKGHKKYFYCGLHFASKIKKKYVVIHDIYREICSQTGRDR